MTDAAGNMTLVSVVLLPAALAILATWRRARRSVFDLSPIAPVPGLAVALLGPRDEIVEFPDLLLGLSFVLDDIGAVFLGFISLLWVLAGAYARAYLPDSARESGFPGFWCATLAGNLGICIAADVIGFYAAFALLSLAAYGLVVHDGTAEAFRAGRVYLVLAILGETSLLLGIMLATQAAGAFGLEAARAALAASPEPNLAVALLVIGFGVKAGLVPLHIWLPLAHPMAPTPASAVLSGAIVNAGALGLMRFLPVDVVLPGWEQILVVAGLITAYFGVLIGLTQSNPKTILAYSTLSQMGIVVAILGSGLGPVPARTLETATLYTLNHALAKGALFLSVGVIAASGRFLRPLMLPTVLVAGAIAGLPMTGGALAKLAIAGPMGTGAAALLVTLSAVGTSLLLLRFLYVVADSRAGDPDAAPAIGLVVPWAAAVVAALVVPWLLFTGLVDLPLADVMGAGNLWAAAWPVLMAALIAVLAVRRSQPLLPAVPEGDLVVPLESALRRSTVVARFELRAASRLRPGRALLQAGARAGGRLDRLETALLRWSFGGAALIAIVLIFGAAFAG